MTAEEKTNFIESNFASILNYLRLEAGDDDAMVKTCAGAAITYIESAVGEFDKDSTTALMLMMAITQDFYDDRQLLQPEQQQKLRQLYTYQSIILQLQT